MYLRSAGLKVWHVDCLMVLVRHGMEKSDFMISCHVSQTWYTTLKRSLKRCTCFDTRGHYQLPFRTELKLLHVFTAITHPVLHVL